MQTQKHIFVQGDEGGGREEVLCRGSNRIIGC